MSALLSSFPSPSACAPPRPNPVPSHWQTGAKGKPVNTLYIAHKMKLKREMYFALLLDRKSAGPVMIGCSEVGCGGLP
jgi:succinyl-CoA synthetase beta subunit